MRLFKGDIVTCDQNNSVFNYLVEDEGRIFYLGDELPAYYSDCKELIDLGSKALLPAFSDGHIHLSSWSLNNSGCDVRSASSIAEIGPIIKRYAENELKEKVLLVFGHSRHSLLEKRLITRTELDEAVKERPVFLICYEGHSAVANTAAIGSLPLELRSFRGFNLESGQILHEAYHAAISYFTGQMKLLKLFGHMNRAIDTIAGYGVGMIHTVEGTDASRDLDVDLVRFMAKSTDIQVRIYFQTMEVNKVIKRKLPRIGGCLSCALDGCFGLKDAALLDPYSDNEQNNGVLFYRDEVVTDFVKKANRAGLQVQLHCSGDAAVVQAVKAIETALEDFPRLDHRHSLIHAFLISEPIMKKIASLGIGITTQPGFLVSPLEPVEYLEQIIGDRVRRYMPLKQMIEMGINVSGGSDGPITIPDPIGGIYGACNHPVPGQSVSISEALRMYTYNNAYNTFDEKDRGSIEKDKIADMVILSQNPLKMKLADLLDLEVDKLYLAGKEYKKESSLPKIITTGLKNWNKMV